MRMHRENGIIFISFRDNEEEGTGVAFALTLLAATASIRRENPRPLREAAE
jgi:hypothetical protein